MSEGNVLAIDLAKSSFYVHLAASNGRILEKKKLSRARLYEFVANCDAKIVAMEACGSANFWARQFIKLGKEPRLIAPQYVKPFVKGNKNDPNDSEGINEAACRHNMRFVPVKTIAQQDIKSLHCLRSRLVAARTALTNQIRGLLAEYGVVVAKGHAKLRLELSSLCSLALEQLPGDLSATMQQELIELRAEFSELDRRIEAYDKKIQSHSDSDPRCCELSKMVGVGPLTATALLAVSGDMAQFKNGRQFAAFLGLVPRQNSTGGKTNLQGISKRGDTYLRTLMIHGARASLATAAKRSDYRSRWAKELLEKKGFNKAAVALANRNARTAYALIRRGQTFDPHRAERQQANALPRAKPAPEMRNSSGRLRAPATREL